MVVVSGTGFSVIDYLYPQIDFNADAFSKYMSKRKGDGGLDPGRLTFVKAYENYTGKTIAEIRKSQGWGHDSDTYNLGGPCIVALVNVAQLTANFNCQVKYYGVLGNDSTANKILGILKKTPVDINNLNIIKNETSSYAICLSDKTYNNGSGERCFLIDIGIWEKISTDQVITPDFFESDILFFGATALTPHIHEDLPYLLHKGKQRGKITVVATVFDHINTLKAPNRRWTMGKSDDSFKFMDLLMMDWDEAMGISGKSTIKEIFDFFVISGVKTFIITHGTNDTYAWSNGMLFQKMDLRTFPVSRMICEALNTTPSLYGDTTGCGDNFAGGVIAYIAECLEKGQKPGEFDFYEAISWGVASGGFACFTVGGTFMEKHPGEKRKLVDNYRQHYLAQIKGSKL